MAGVQDDGAEPQPLYSIGELSREFGVTSRTIRFYESKGLLSPFRKGSTRFYSKRDRAQLILVLRGKNLGFTLEEIREYLDLYAADTTQVAQLEHLLGKIDDRMELLRRKKVDLERTQSELKTIRNQVMAALKESRERSTD
jgi:DNA-binding transcriptional MerR regulator